MLKNNTTNILKALRVVLLLYTLVITTTYARSPASRAQDALTKAVMKVPLVKDTKFDLEQRVLRSDLHYLMYLVPIYNHSLIIKQAGWLLQYDNKASKIILQYGFRF